INAAPKPSDAQSLDTTKVKRLYQEGDFEQSIAILESMLKEKKVTNHRDSVFVFKHLGVMYAANDHSRERGKYFMLQLLTIEPTARIMDMYASDMIYMIFKNIQEEYATTHTRYVRAEKHVEGNNGTDAKPQSKPDAENPAETRKPEGHKKAFILMGATAAAIGVGVAVFLLTDDPPPKSTDFEVR
ncbi:MAG: hypothetical protein M3Y08_13320, partial [Fibrobacterota bacterium]|nr:hypothetical protein [Fibrobacterota bacterium]